MEARGDYQWTPPSAQDNGQVTFRHERFLPAPFPFRAGTTTHDDWAAHARAIRTGADSETRAENQRTPLIWAAIAGNIDTVNALLQAGADVDARDDTERTPLVYAARFRHGDIVRDLREYGGDAPPRE